MNSFELSSDGNTTDQRLSEAMEAYVERLKSNKHVDEDEFLKQYADVADELRLLLPGLDLVQSCTLAPFANMTI